jgi:hypothetical protein
VGRPVCKTGWGCYAVPGGFDSHALPPTSRRRLRACRGIGLFGSPGCSAASSPAPDRSRNRARAFIIGLHPVRAAEWPRDLVFQFVVQQAQHARLHELLEHGLPESDRACCSRRCRCPARPSRCSADRQRASSSPGSSLPDRHRGPRSVRSRTPGVSACTSSSVGLGAAGTVLGAWRHRAAGSAAVREPPTGASSAGRAWRRLRLAPPAGAPPCRTCVLRRDHRERKFWSGSPMLIQRGSGCRALAGSGTTGPADGAAARV